MKNRNIHIVFHEHECSIYDWATQTRKRIQVGVYIDLDQLAELAADAAKNKGRKAHDGPLYVEFHQEIGGAA